MNEGAKRKLVNESTDAEGNGKRGGPRFIQQKKMNGIEGKRRTTRRRRRRRRRRRQIRAAAVVVRSSSWSWVRGVGIR